MSSGHHLIERIKPGALKKLVNDLCEFRLRFGLLTGIFHCLLHNLLSIFDVNPDIAKTLAQNLIHHLILFNGGSDPPNQAKTAFATSDANATPECFDFCFSRSRRCDDEQPNRTPTEAMGDNRRESNIYEPVILKVKPVCKCIFYFWQSRMKVLALQRKTYKNP